MKFIRLEETLVCIDRVQTLVSQSQSDTRFSIVHVHSFVHDASLKASQIKHQQLSKSINKRHQASSIVIKHHQGSS